ncbi:hypothetical protein F4809DRAFT_589293 [Biscogniauxia mediterranea]|nr:hypothetical protein F4809DRAFT_589293 [Biscogniauxia mediterranea]
MLAIRALAAFFSLPHKAADTGHELARVGNWSLFNSHINCSTMACDYSFGLFEDEQRRSYACDFTVHSHEVPPDQTHFEAAVCHGADDTHWVNGAWMQNHSIVLCFTNIAEEVSAWFGFDDWEIEGGVVAPNKTSPAYTIGDFGDGKGNGKRSTSGSPDNRQYPTIYPPSLYWKRIQNTN